MTNKEIEKLLNEGVVGNLVKTGVKYALPVAAGVAAYLRGRSMNQQPQPPRQQPAQPQGPDFSTLPKFGNAGNIPQRTNNPGNITLSPKEDFAKSNARRLGASGEWTNPANGRRYATFADPSSGYRAVHSLITSNDYASLTPRQAINRYVNGSPDRPADSMYFDVLKQHGIDPDKGKFGDYDPMKRVQAIAQAEGAYARRTNEETLPAQTAGTTFKKGEVDKNRSVSAGASRGSQKLGLGKEMPQKGVIAPRLTREDVINKTLDKYLPKDTIAVPTLEESLLTNLEGLSESHAHVILELFYKLNEENQYNIVDMVSRGNINQLLDFALENRGK